MIKKIIAIKNVGKFRNYAASGDVELRKLTLLHGENGRGKTTTCAVFRSLASGDPLYISERRTVDAADHPHIDVLTENGKATFAANAWSAKYEPLVIFDSTYVAENVYSGDYIELDQKKRLYQVSIGKKGVELATQVSALDGQSRGLASNIGLAATALSKIIPKGMTLEDFLGLAKDDEIDKKIAAKKSVIKTLEDADAIKAKTGFTKVIVPTLPLGFAELLSKTLEGVSKDAEAKILKHAQEHKMDKSGAAWISQGVPYIQSDSCPFCGLDVKNNDLLDAYRSYFSKSYNDFKAELAKFKTELGDAISDKKMATIKTTLVQNLANSEFWKHYAPIVLPAVSYEEPVEPVVQRLIDDVIPLAKQKVDAPLDAIAITAQAEEAITSLFALAKLLVEYNVDVDIANAEVAKIKQASQAENSALVRSELIRLEAQKTRHTEDVAKACTDYSAIQREKTAVEAEKARVKGDLDQYTDEILGTSEEAINKILERIGAGFRIAGTKQQYVGGSPSSTFKLSINGVAVDLGDSRTPRGTPCFRTAMSSGDRNTLALAFFLVQVQQRPDLSLLTVVLDDPLTSLDRFRQQFTRDQIRAIEKKAKQVIVLSHEPAFLELIADGYDPAHLRLLCVSRDGVNNSTIKPWDMKAELASGYHKDIATIASFHHGDGGDLRAVIRCLRPVLETYLRQSYHGEFLEKEWLGDMIAKIRSAVAGQPLAVALPTLGDIESLNDYTKRYHHDDNSAKQGNIPIQDAELQSFSALALKLINRL